MRHRAAPVDGTRPPRRAAERLLGGDQLVVTDHYSTGAEILASLGELTRLQGGAQSFSAREAANNRFREAAIRLIAPIIKHKLNLSGAHPIGFLSELYPRLDRFDLSFIEIQELYGAWERYTSGQQMAVLGHKVHPFYGTYAPTRTSHLELFGTWLKSYDGPREFAIDVGTGCGVLAFMLAKAGFSQVLATDNNPNSIESVNRDLERLKLGYPIEVTQGDLLCYNARPSDLIVFNPPWVLGTTNSQLDRALYFEHGLFERFFEQAIASLSPHGRIVMVFSNVIELMQPEVPHPIKAELNRGRLTLVNLIQRKVKPKRDEHGHRRITKEKVEIWELALK
jgi:hypothetical protein